MPSEKCFIYLFIAQISKGKLHGCIDVGLSVMSIKKKAMCIDLDTEDNIYHLKVTLETFSYIPRYFSYCCLRCILTSKGLNLGRSSL